MRPRNDQSHPRLLFLDIDGVMISFGEREIVHECATNLRAVMTGVPGLGIVLTSTWRLPPIERLMRLWRKAVLPETWIVGVTPDLALHPHTVPERLRGMEIRRWLDEHQKAACRYAILDDQCEEVHPCFPPEEVFATNPVIGLDHATSHRVARWLNTSL